MDVRYSRELTVGTLVLIAVALFIFGTMWLSGRSITEGNLIRIQFPNAAGLKKASPVRVSGVAVGKVERIQFRGVGDILVTASLRDDIQPKRDATAQIVSVSLVGDYAVDLEPGRAVEPLPEGAVIPGRQEAGLTGMAEGLAGRADTLLGNLNVMTGAETTEDLRQTLRAMQRALDVMARELPPTTRAAADAMQSFDALAARLDSTLASPGVAARVDTITANLAAMTGELTRTGARLDSVLMLVQRGEGTLGRMATDSTLYYNLVGVTASLDSLLTTLRRDPGKIQVIAPVKVF